MRSWLTSDLGWKLVCLAIAVVLWMGASGTGQLTSSVAAPVQYRNLPRELDISSDMVEQVHLHLRGPSQELSKLTPRGMAVVIDLSKVRVPGERTFTIDRSMLSLPPDVSLERAVPAQIRLRMENRASREVPIALRLQHVPPGMEVVSQDLSPAQINIVGPESRVAALKIVETDPVDLTGVEIGEVEMRTNVFAGDPQVSIAGSAVVTIKLRLAAARR